MLQAMRDNLKGTVAFIIVGFLAFIMAASLVNLSGNSHSTEHGEVATVNKQVITERDVQIGMMQERQNLQNQYGDSLPAEFLSEERLRAPVIQGLVVNKALIDKAASNGMVVPVKELDKLILQTPNFQEEGIFNRELFVENLRRIGHTPASYKNVLEETLIAEELRNAFTATAVLTPAYIEQAVALSQQKRDFSWLSLPLGDLPGQIQVADEEIQSYYDANKANYLTEERVAVEYIQVKVSDFNEQLIVTEEELQSQYQAEISQIEKTTEREAAHILIEGDSDEAQEKLAQVQEKLSAGEDFSALAAAYSDDFGSKGNGGFLGTTTGDAFPEAFEAALLELGEGEVSGPVQIDGATHIIKLLRVKKTEIPTFDASRGRIEAELKNLQAEERFIETVAALKDLAYNADNLADVAEQLALSVEKTALFTRAGNLDPVLGDRLVLDAAFSEQVLTQGFTSDVLELTPQHALVLNLIEHQPVRTLSLEEKRDDIIAQLQLSQAKTQLREQLDGYISALSAGSTLSELAEQHQLTMNKQVGAERNSSTVDQALISHVFSLSRPTDDKPVLSTIYLENNDLALVSLTAVTDADFNSLTEEEQRSIRLSLSRGLSTIEYQAWQSLLLDEADVTYKAGAAY
ncbi:MAG: SurA N-terminal domain-containing protein [Cellvibrionaceae bacterium]|nr:SurA N-terminal domain-containing protein [Cellvibrionaceae bacterium]